MNDLSLYLSLWGKYVHMHVCTIFVYDKTNKYITIRKKKQKKKLGTYIVETACILLIIILWHEVLLILAMYNVYTTQVATTEHATCSHLAICIDPIEFNQIILHNKSIHNYTYIYVHILMCAEFIIINIRLAMKLLSVYQNELTSD